MSDTDYIKAKLESAGKTMMMQPATGTRPAGYKSGWPEIIREFQDMIEAPKENTKAWPRATMQQMNELDEVEDWIVHLSVVCREKRIPWVARVVQLGSLCWPTSERRVFTWAKLARKMGVSDTSVKNWYNDGVDIIRSYLAQDGRTETLDGAIIPLKPKEK